MNIVKDGDDYAPQPVSTWRLRELLQCEKDNLALREEVENLRRTEIEHTRHEIEMRIEIEGLVRELGDLRAKEPPLLMCVDCKNTESCAGAMARTWQHGLCMHCGGAFKVVRA